MNKTATQILLDEIQILKNQIHLISGTIETLVKTNEDLMTSENAAKYLGISTGALRQLVFKNKLLPRKFEDGRKNYFLKSEIINMLKTVK
ncbi:MAG: helix-turn-helix domain-containing protein [Ignavibacteriae bacterium]|nr:helix-turn-helix domain-containing protein [Ignavibacteriota bacterium]